MSTWNTGPAGPPPTNPDSELDEILDIIAAISMQTITPLEAKTKLLQWSAKRELEARKEQIMQDFLSLIDLPPNFEEQDLIEWRADQLAALNKELEEL